MAESIDTRFLRLVNENLGIVRKVTGVYFHNPADREDAEQEMMYQLWKAYPHFEGRSKFSTWMYTVCLNTAFTWRKRSRRFVTEGLTRSHEQIATPLSEGEEERLSALKEAMTKLTPLNRAIILLYLDDLSYDEMASVTGLSKSNVSVRLVRVKKELETYLKLKMSEL